MAYVFVSHSRRDTRYLDLLNKAFATTALMAKYEEIEAIDRGARNGEQIAEDIRSAVAVFVLLTENVENREHTRDWVAWEAGVGHDKELWVLEPAEEGSRVSMVVPRVDHCVAFRLTDVWISHFRQVLDWIVRKRRVERAAFWAEMLTPTPPLLTRTLISEYFMEDRLEHPSLTVRTFECSCNARYTLHREKVSAFRCPICNKHYSFEE